MTIQVPNPGTGNGATGDNEFVLWSKVKANFEDQTNAASRLVGITTGKIPLAENIPSLLGTAATKNTGTGTGNVMQVGAFGLGGEVSISDADSTSNSTLEFINNLKKQGCQFFRCNQVVDGVQRYSAGIYAQTYNTYMALSASYSGGGVSIVAGQADNFVVYTLYHSKSSEIYSTTTASGANVVVTSSGELRRSTSSERYKDILADLELDDAAYQNAMQLAPIVYRSTADADNPEYHYYSFSAEALGAYDPAFTLWRDTETVTDDEGNTSEQPLDERVAEGINLNAIVAFLHATNVKQGKLIAEQAAAIGTLTNRIDNMAAE